MPVKQLAPYQLKVWRALLDQQRVLVVKTHKCGLSTSQLLADFQLAILPSSNQLSSSGYDTLLISQTKDIAKELLRTQTNDTKVERVQPISHCQAHRDRGVRWRQRLVQIDHARRADKDLSHLPEKSRRRIKALIVLLEVFSASEVPRGE